MGLATLRAPCATPMEDKPISRKRLKPESFVAALASLKMHRKEPLVPPSIGAGTIAVQGFAARSPDGRGCRIPPCAFRGRLSGLLQRRLDSPQNVNLYVM
jgi:hypothetical protein